MIIVNRQDQTIKKYFSALDEICIIENCASHEIAQNITQIAYKYNNTAVRLFKDFVDEV